MIVIIIISRRIQSDKNIWFYEAFVRRASLSKDFGRKWGAILTFSSIHLKGVPIPLRGQLALLLWYWILDRE